MAGGFNHTMKQPQICLFWSQKSGHPQLANGTLANGNTWTISPENPSPLLPKWVKVEPPGTGPQILVHVSIYQGLRHFGVPRFFSTTAKWPPPPTPPPLRSAEARNPQLQVQNPAVGAWHRRRRRPVRLGEAANRTPRLRRPGRGFSVEVSFFRISELFSDWFI